MLAAHQVAKLYRCWIIWGKRWVVVAAPGFLALITLAGGLALTALDNSPLWNTDQEKISRLFRLTGITTYSISLAVNALTTSLIVTKIFLTSRRTRLALGSNSHRSLRIVAATMIESGLLMLAFQLVFIVLFLRGPEFDVVSCMTTQIYGITPTLLNIRVVMGSTFDKATEKTRSLRFIHSGGIATRTTDLSISTAGVEPQGINIELYDISYSKRTADGVV
ncbi:hypothetical protein BD779DRAFT_1681043 [Infundibulicybe gibba]|nr:hypothetical protein BD779DRAFT_1681043 [Infundibulicybe gibba]